VIGEMDRPSAKELIFDNAVYIHLGRQYIVEKLDIDNRSCHVVEKDLDYWTDAVVKTDIEVLTEDERGSILGTEYVLGDVLVRTQAEKYKKLRFHSHENIGYGEISLPPEEMQTRAIILLLGSGRVGASLGLDGAGGEEPVGDSALRAAVLSGSGRLLHDLAPAFLMCDPRDLGRVERVRDPHFGVPAIYLYDKYPGGTGLSEGLARLLGKTVAAARERLSACPCGGGCPSCIGVDFADRASIIEGSLVKRRVLELFGAMEEGHGGRP
jgi:DEAD/DEAH box helicase domain-containing protein